MSKPISFRLEEEVITLLDEKSKAAGVTKTDLLTKLIIDGEAETCIQCVQLQARIDRLEGKLAALEDEGQIARPSPLRQAARSNRQVEVARAVGSSLARLGFKPCEHGYRPDLCRTEKCRRSAR